MCGVIGVSGCLFGATLVSGTSRVWASFHPDTFPFVVVSLGRICKRAAAIAPVSVIGDEMHAFSACAVVTWRVLDLWNRIHNGRQSFLLCVVQRLHTQHEAHEDRTGASNGHKWKTWIILLEEPGTTGTGWDVQPVLAVLVVIIQFSFFYSFFFFFALFFSLHFPSSV